ncbi:ccr4 associated factor [Podila epigama]|nr:ccr4 associated factor [Podila epigama]
MSPTSDHSRVYIPLPTRGLLEIRGKDASKFLQGLITNHMPRIEAGGGGFLAAFLSPKGRVMYDVFVHPLNLSGKEQVEPSFLIECDARALPDLHKHIARFVLRSKVKMVGVTESYDIYSVLDTTNVETEGSDDATFMERIEGMGATIGTLDSRAGNLMGLRVIVPKGQKLSLPDSYRHGSLEEYHMRRIINGVPEGLDDFIPGTSLPLESFSIDMIIVFEVDFRKGCYVGQELTIRTYHKGITRKRVMPVQYFKSGEPEPESIEYSKMSVQVIPPQSELFPAKSDLSNATPIASSSSARPVRASGRTGSNVGNIGLALVKLDSAAEGQIFEVMDREGMTTRAKAFFPSWWPKQAEDEQK